MIDKAKMGEFISQNRKEMNLTQKQLAEMLGVTDKTISKWETGMRIPDADVLLDLCNVLSVNVNDLLRGETSVTDNNVKEIKEKNIVNLVSEINELTENREEKRKSVFIVGALFILLWGGIVMQSLGIGNVKDLIALPILLELIGLIVITSILTGAWKYIKDISRVLGNHKNKFSREELLNTISFILGITAAIGIILSFINLVSVFECLDNIKMVGPYIANVILVLLYTAIIELIIFAMKYKIQKKI